MIASRLVILSLALFPNRDQLAQWWIHLGTRSAPPATAKPLVFLITGQSNAGNYGEGARQQADSRILNLNKGDSSAR